MGIIAKFVIIVPENASWIEHNALEMYIKLLPEAKEEAESYVEDNLSADKLIWGQNDFSTEMLMTYDKEIPLAFLQLTSKYANKYIQAQKPIGIQHIIHTGETGLRELLERAIQIAIQRKYTLIWIKALRNDRILIELLLSSGYEEFEPRELEQDISLIEYIYFKKALI